MTFGFISDKPASEREQFLLELVNQLEELGAERFGVFAILPNGDTFQGYYHMEFGDKLLMSGHVQMDAVDTMICNNRERYLDDGDESMACS